MCGETPKRFFTKNNCKITSKKLNRTVPGIFLSTFVLIVNLKRCNLKWPSSFNSYCTVATKEFPKVRLEMWAEKRLLTDFDVAVAVGYIPEQLASHCVNCLR